LEYNALLDFVAKFASCGGNRASGFPVR